MKTTWNCLASTACILATSFTLHAGTYFVQSLGGTDGPPYPFDPTYGAAPITEIGPDQYFVDDSDSLSLESSGMMMSANSLDPNDATNGTGGGSYSPPNIRNYAKYSQQVFSFLDTNSLAETDTNLLNACAAMPIDTNTAPMLFIHPYGPNAVIIRADNFDYSQTNLDFALIVCDKVETPTWKTIDFGGTSDAQDGWLVQGTVPNWKVSTTMFMLVTNINLVYPAFFRAIPYSGPQVAINGVPSPYDVVSNIITFNAQIYDLSGTTNEQFTVDVDGFPCRYSLSTSNTFTMDTPYYPNGACNVYLEVLNQAGVGDPTNHPSADTPLFFKGLNSIPLDFENDTFLLMQSDFASPDIGTNYIEFVINKPQYCAAIISHPSTGVPVFAATNYFSTPGAIAVPWNFTEADGVTPYSETNYAVQLIAFDPQTLNFTNSIDFTGVRHGAGTFLAYEDEDYGSTEGTYLNSQASTWMATEQELFNDIYKMFSFTQYTPGQVGDHRDFSITAHQSSTTPAWETFMIPAITNTYTTNASTYSDITISQAHGSGSTIGGANKNFTNDFNTLDLAIWMSRGPLPNGRRLRKAAFWACYSSSYKGLQSMTTPYPGFPDACGIRAQGLQEISYMRKNCGLFFNGLIPQGGYGGNNSVVTAQVAEALDQIWVCGQNNYPGGCDPTYSFRFAINTTRGMYNPQLDSAGPLLFGLGQMIYSSVYDDELLMLNYTDVKRP
jgi:hypothetical protein